MADVFDALCSKRCYKDAWTYDDAFAYMQEKAGGQFDPVLIDALFAEKEQVLELYQKFTD